MRTWISVLLIGVAAWAQDARVKEKRISPGASAESPKSEPRIVTVSPPGRQVCSIPLINVLPQRFRAPQGTPDERMIKPIPKPGGTTAEIRQVPLPAPPCDDVK